MAANQQGPGHNARDLQSSNESDGLPSVELLISLNLNVNIINSTNIQVTQLGSSWILTCSSASFSRIFGPVTPESCRNLMPYRNIEKLAHLEPSESPKSLTKHKQTPGNTRKTAGRHQEKSPLLHPVVQPIASADVLHQPPSEALFDRDFWDENDQIPC